jgi:hypothetical protein
MVVAPGFMDDVKDDESGGFESPCSALLLFSERSCGAVGSTASQEVEKQT